MPTARRLLAVPALVAPVIACCLTLPAGASQPGSAGPAAAPVEPPAVIPGPSVRAPMKVVVTIAPLKGLVEPLLPKGSSIELLIPPGVSEHGYEIPLPKLATLARCDLVVTVGLGLDGRVTSFLAERPREGRRSVEFAKAAGVAGAAACDHDHDHAGHDHAQHDHAHQHAVDPHLWLDPALASKLVQAASESLRELEKARSRPADGAARPGVVEALAEINAAERALLARLSELDSAYRTRLAACPTRTLVVAHDAWGRLAGRYGLRAVALSGLTAGEPTPKAISDAVNAVRAEAARAVFCEPQLNPAASERVAKATGVPLLKIDPLGDGDYFTMMRRNLDELVRGLGGPAPAGAGGK